MTTAAWDKRFQESTRGQIVALLRRGARSVDELATATGLTDNAVRAHLAGLERDGFVQQTGVRRSGGVGKPAFVYELSPSVEQLFSRAYVPTLVALVETLTEHLSPSELDSVMREAGERIAHTIPPLSGDIDARVVAAGALLEQLGGVVAPPEREGDTIVLRGLGCPLGAVTGHEPAVCHAVESMLSAVIGSPVHERCERGERPRCAFAIRQQQETRGNSG